MSESIYLTLLMGSLVAIAYKRWLIASLLLGFMCILRANGLLMLLPVAIFIMEENGSWKKLLPSSEVFAWKNISQHLVFLVPSAVFVGYCVYQYQKTGDAFAYSTAQQKGWNREFMFPLMALFRMGGPTGQFNSCYAIIFILIGIFVWKKLPLSFNLIIWLTIFLPMMSGNVEGFPRYITTAFPLFFLAGRATFNWSWKYALLGIALPLQLFTFYFWLTYSPFSY